MRLTFVIGALVAAVGVILLMQFWPSITGPDPLHQIAIDPAVSLATTDGPGDSERMPEVRPGAASTPLEAATRALPVEPAVELPGLENSDEFLREQVSTWPLPEVWLQRENLISRMAVVVQNAAGGQVPRRQLGFLVPTSTYPVTKVGEQYFVDAAGYRRYDVLINMLESIPAQELSQLVKLVDPLLVQAMVALGERRTPGQLLSQALSRVQALPELPDDIELLRPEVMYTYADPALEARSELDKQLLRIGPDNLLRLKSYLIDFSDFYFQK